MITKIDICFKHRTYDYITKKKKHPRLSVIGEMKQSITDEKARRVVYTDTSELYVLFICTTLNLRPEFATNT